MSFKEISCMLKSDTPITWLFYGNSITQGAFHTFGYRDYSELFEERIRFEMERSMDIVINSAISGNTTVELLQSFDWRVKRFLPNIVFLMIGMNDCSEDGDISLEDFDENLKELITRLRSIEVLPVLQTTCPVLCGPSPERELQFSGYMDTIRNLAEEQKIPLIDHTEYWQDHIDKHYLWMSNKFHPNEYGHRTFANLLFKKLNIFDPSSPTCHLFIP
jgi:acyl-CoA thioesterase I